MKEVPIYEIKEDISLRYAPIADSVRKELKEKKTYLLNVMSSPGSGKTTLLIELINKLKDKLKIAVIETDIDGREDAQRIFDATSVRTIQIHTGGACHLTSQMSKEALAIIGDEHYDFIILENIGNLVCPAEFDTGASLNMVILSVPEGTDKPLKYPLMFEKSNLVLINKIDAIEFFDFDYNIVESFILKRNKNAKIFKISAKNNVGTEEVAEYLAAQIEAWRK